MGVPEEKDRKEDGKHIQKNNGWKLPKYNNIDLHIQVPQQIQVGSKQIDTYTNIS